ncbi:MAG: S49 family peptidase [Aeromicrobium sp.]|nr:S49 family peptidase [Burkholderiales bacterium]
MENTSVPTAPAEDDKQVAAKTNAAVGWERSVLETLAMETLAEQKRARRWRTTVSLLWLGFFSLVLLLIFGATAGRQSGATLEKHTALIEVKGVISAESKASADKVIAALQAAFKDKNTQGVVMRIDSPGGSPVQSGYINDEMKRLRALHKDIPLYVVVQDICASGGYYIAAAADRIFVDKASIVGSVGVLMDGFGFTGTMDKLGVERRLVTAGANKGFLDPFSPVNLEQQKFAQQMVNEIHEQFIKVVREGRGKRLKETPEMFSGLVWSGEKSVALGLADGFGGLEYVAREVIKAEAIVDYTPEDSLSEQFARRIGVSASDSLWKSLSAKLLSERSSPSLR